MDEPMALEVFDQSVSMGALSASFLKIHLQGVVAVSGGTRSRRRYAGCLWALGREPDHHAT